MLSVLASFSAAEVKYPKKSNLEKEGVLPTILRGGEIKAGQLEAVLVTLCL